tara:strand:- start:314 stop:667 length:354 start_codon:yes stop_codon:yes gene_type:complete
MATALGPSTTLVHYLKRNDSLPDLEVTLQDSSGTALSLTGATVKFSMKNDVDNTIKIDKTACTLISGVTGGVKYNFTSANTNVAGTYQAEFQIEYANSDVLTVPTQGAVSVVILEDV